MDIATIIGIVLGFGLIMLSILLDGDLGPFFNAPGLLIVVGGTIAATFIAEKMEHVIGTIKVMKMAFKLNPSNAAETIETIVKLSNIARREGVLALENQKVDDEFLGKGIRMAADGLPQEEIRATLSAEMVTMKERHVRGQSLLKFMGTTAPSMGMIGTLIGLVQMLRNLSDPAAIGPAMAIALLTTLYGAILAFLVFNPIADKLDKRTAEETANMVVVIEGIDSIVRGQNAATIKDKLSARLSPKERAAAGGDQKAA